MIPARPLRFSLDADASVTLFGGAAALVGWSITNLADDTETACNIYDGPASADYLLFPITLLPNESTREQWPPGGVEIKNSLTVAASGGGAYGTLFVIAGEIIDAYLLELGYHSVWSGTE